MRDATDITLVLDRTGSMEAIRSDTIGGFNRFLKDQQAVPGICAMTLVQFDSQDPYEVVYRGVPIAEAKPLTPETYVPRAATPLLDAMGRGINDTGARLAAMPESERPDKVVFVVLTDGLENASHEFTRAQVAQMIEQQRDAYKWQFVFLGANMDAVQEGGKMGIHVASAMTYRATPQGVRAAYQSTSDVVAAYRSGLTANVAFRPEDRDTQAQGGATSA